MRCRATRGAVRTAPDFPEAPTRERLGQVTGREGPAGTHPDGPLMQAPCVASRHSLITRLDSKPDVFLGTHSTGSASRADMCSLGGQLVERLQPSRPRWRPLCSGAVVGREEVAPRHVHPDLRRAQLVPPGGDQTDRSWQRSRQPRAPRRHVPSSRPGERSPRTSRACCSAVEGTRAHPLGGLLHPSPRERAVLAHMHFPREHRRRLHSRTPWNACTRRSNAGPGSWGSSPPGTH